MNSASDGHALKYVGYELLQKYDLITKFKINNNMLDSFLLQLEVGYSKYKNPYHNLAHGADVAQTVHTILSQSKLVVSFISCYFSSSDRWAAYLMNELIVYQKVRIL